MAYGRQDHGDRGSRCEPVFTLQERLNLRLASHKAEAQARLPVDFKADGLCGSLSPASLPVQTGRGLL